MSLGATNEVVNANKFAVFFGASSEYILAVRKEVVYNAPQKKLATGAGPVFFTMLADDQLLLEFAYTTGEVGNGVGANWDEMLKRNATTGEVPEEEFRIKATDRQGSPVTKTHTMNCKATQLRCWGGAEGETLASLRLQIIDTEPSIA